MATTEFVVSTLLYFLSVAWESVCWSNTTDPRLLHDERMVIVSLTACVRQYIEDLFGFFSVVRKTGFSPVKS